MTGRARRQQRKRARARRVQVWFDIESDLHWADEHHPIDGAAVARLTRYLADAVRGTLPVYVFTIGDYVHR